MSILIKGMEMPPSCAECALNYDCFKCIVTGTPFFDHERHFDDETTRLDNCPLVPVPPHGDLIDRAELVKHDHQHYEYLSDEFYITVRDIENAPTIIEEER